MNNEKIKNENTVTKNIVTKNTVAENTTKVINNPHDKGYKKDLKKPSEFLHFLQKYVGAEWTKELEVSQITLCDKEFITKDYEGKEADILYSVMRKDGSRIYVFVLQELQSTVDQTMIFRVLVYIMNVLTDYFMKASKETRQKAGFKLPSIVPIVFYNGKEKWTAAQELKDYLDAAEFFGEYTLNLKYYLVDLSKIEEEYILSTNTTLDNIMYCDKFREKAELLAAINGAVRRVEQLGKQEKEEFLNWAENILFTICKDNKEQVKEYLEMVRDGGGEMAFEYNIVRVFREDREKAIAEGLAEGRSQGLSEGRREGRIEGRREGRIEGQREGRIEGFVESILDLLSEYDTVSTELCERITAENDIAILKKWHKIAARVASIKEFEEKIDLDLIKK